MKNKRKKKIKIIQVILFSIALLIFISTYYEQLFDKQKYQKTKKNEINEKLDSKEGPSNLNQFEFVEYVGIDNSGNEFKINAGKANIDVDKPDLINLVDVKANFFLKEGMFTVTSKYGIYNSVTYDIFFSTEILAIYNDKTLVADNLDFINSKGVMNVYGNVKANSIEGNLETDRASLDLSSKQLNLSNVGNEKVKIKLN